ncbi:MAG: hypothetical protein AAF441_05370 [Pseudomonadota bacterium]
MQHATQTPDSRHLNPAAVRHWGTKFGSEKIAAVIAASDRFAPRALRRVYKAHRLNGAACGSEQDTVNPVTVYLSDKKRFTQLAGLIMYGATIRRMITAEDFEQLAQHFTREDLSLACRQADLHVHNSEVNIPDGGLVSVIERAGEALVQTWKLNLCPEALTELSLFDEQAANPASARLTRIDPEVSSAIAGRVAGLMPPMAG